MLENNETFRHVWSFSSVIIKIKVGCSAHKFKCNSKKLIFRLLDFFLFVKVSNVLYSSGILIRMVKTLNIDPNKTLIKMGSCE